MRIRARRATRPLRSVLARREGSESWLNTDLDTENLPQFSTASMAGLTSPPFMAPYNVAKHGVVALSESMFIELQMMAPNVGITVVCPGWVQTQIHNSVRNRPTTGEQAPDSAATEEDAENLRNTIGALIADGLQPSDVAEQVFTAVSTNRFYVLTHPDWSHMVLRNTERMLAGENPQMAIPGQDARPGE